MKNLIWNRGRNVAQADTPFGTILITLVSEASAKWRVGRCPVLSLADANFTGESVSAAREYAITTIENAYFAACEKVPQVDEKLDQATHILNEVTNEPSRPLEGQVVVHQVEIALEIDQVTTSRLRALFDALFVLSQRKGLPPDVTLRLNNFDVVIDTGLTLHNVVALDSLTIDEPMLVFRAPIPTTNKVRLTYLRKVGSK